MFTRRTRTHQRALGANADAVIEITSGRGEPSAYAVVLRVFQQGAWHTVRSFDNAHGQHDEHRYTREGEKQPATKFCDGGVREALDQVLAHIAQHWQRMSEEWRRSTNNT